MQVKKGITIFLAVLSLLLIVAVILLSTILARGGDPLDKIISDYREDYLDSALTIVRLTGDNALLTAEQIKTFCPSFNLSDYYLVEIVKIKTKGSMLYAIGLDGVERCMIDRMSNSSANTSSQLAGTIATINGEPLTNDEVLLIYNAIPVNLRTNASLQLALEQAVNNKLLIQDAIRRGLSVNDSEVDAVIEALKRDNGLTEEALEENIRKSGSTLGKFRDNIVKDLLVQKEVFELTKDSLIPSDEEVRDFYDANKDNISSIGRATVRQIMIYANETNKDEKFSFIKDVASMMNATNFCELVALYSDDRQSIQTCGQYDFRAGELLPEFESVVFNTSVGTVKLIGTRIGYHIVQVLNVTLPQKLSFEESRQGVFEHIIVMRKQMMLSDFIASLRENAEIVNLAK